MNDYERLVVERHGPVGWLVFDRPDVANAIDGPMFVEIERAWHELDDDPDVVVIVNTGNGRAFQTGLDVVALARDKASLREASRQTRDAELALTAWQLGIAKPVIAAVNGVCAGGGLHFVADADIVVAAASATFLDPHVSIGQVSAYETIALARTSPTEPIMRMALVGRHEHLDAHRARQLGVVGEVVPDGALRDHVQHLGEQIAHHPPEHLAAIKRALWGALERPARARTKVEPGSGPSGAGRPPGGW